MHRLILLLLFSFTFMMPINNQPAFAKTVIINNTETKIIHKDLNRLENLYFNKKYSNDSLDNRLERLEYKVFGAIQNGSDTQRLARLKKAAIAYRNMKNLEMERAYAPYYEQSIFRSGNGWRGLFNNWGNNFGNYYSGYPTGVTPPIYYGNDLGNGGFYNNSYNPSRELYGSGTSKSYRTNTGWGSRYTTTGAKSGVTILD